MAAPQPNPIPGQRQAEAPDERNAALLARLRPYVRQTGDDYRKPWLLKERRLLDYLIVYIAEGTGRFRVGGETFDVGRGDLVWIPPDTGHQMEGFAPTMHCVFAHFDLLYDPTRSHWDACIPGGVEDLSPWMHLCHPATDVSPVCSWLGRLPVSNGGAIGTLLSAMCVEHRRSPATGALRLGGMLLEMVGLIQEGLSPVQRAQPHWQTVQSAVAFIQDHADQELDVARLAGAVQLSESHFRRVFREVTGESPRTLHRRARIRKACQMLIYETNMNVSQIAYSLGFSTVHNFSRAFRDVTGVPPTAYRLAGETPPSQPKRQS